MSETYEVEVKVTDLRTGDRIIDAGRPAEITGWRYEPNTAGTEAVITFAGGRVRPVNRDDTATLVVTPRKPTEAQARAINYLIEHGGTATGRDIPTEYGPLWEGIRRGWLTRSMISEGGQRWQAYTVTERGRAAVATVATRKARTKHERANAATLYTTGRPAAGELIRATRRTREQGTEFIRAQIKLDTRGRTRVYVVTNVDTGERYGVFYGQNSFEIKQAPAEAAPAAPAADPDAGRVLDVEQARAEAIAEDVSRYVNGGPDCECANLARTAARGHDDGCPRKAYMIAGRWGQNPYNSGVRYPHDVGRVLDREQARAEAIAEQAERDADDAATAELTAAARAHMAEVLATFAADQYPRYAAMPWTELVAAYAACIDDAHAEALAIAAADVAARTSATGTAATLADRPELLNAAEARARSDRALVAGRITDHPYTARSVAGCGRRVVRRLADGDDVGPCGWSREAHADQPAEVPAGGVDDPLLRMIDEHERETAEAPAPVAYDAACWHGVPVEQRSVGWWHPGSDTPCDDPDPYLPAERASYLDQLAAGGAEVPAGTDPVLTAAAVLRAAAPAARTVYSPAAGDADRYNEHGAPSGDAGPGAAPAEVPLDAIPDPEPIVDAGGYLPCGCHGSQREHTCGPVD